MPPLLLPREAAQVFVACSSEENPELPEGTPLWETPEQAAATCRKENYG
ncbi:hypothetical protein [Rhodothermus marinus]|nr:hypothetical protein [Rhodothermus marinus]